MNLLDELVVSLEPLGFKIDGPAHEYSFYCEDLRGSYAATRPPVRQTNPPITHIIPILPIPT